MGSVAAGSSLFKRSCRSQHIYRTLIFCEDISTYISKYVSASSRLTTLLQCHQVQRKRRNCWVEALPIGLAQREDVLLALAAVKHMSLLNIWALTNHPATVMVGLSFGECLVLQKTEVLNLRSACNTIYAADFVDRRADKCTESNYNPLLRCEFVFFTLEFCTTVENPLK